MITWKHFGKAAALLLAAGTVVTAGAQTFHIDGTEPMLLSESVPATPAAMKVDPFSQFHFSTGIAPMVTVEDAEASFSSSLPEAPSALIDPQAQTPGNTLPQGVMMPQDPPTGHAPRIAPLRDKYIPAGYAYYHLTAKDKVYIGLRDLYSVGNFGAIFLSAGYEQITNGAPNYGTDKGAFGQRLGAAGIRETSQGIFTDCIFSPLFHEDPRYFVEGPNHSLLNRTFHVVSRVFVTRSDHGGHTVNAALILGYAATTAMQPLYYPQINRNFRDEASSFGGSLGGAAIGFAFDEFADSLLQAVHLEKKP